MKKIFIVIISITCLCITGCGYKKTSQSLENISSKLYQGIEYEYNKELGINEERKEMFNLNNVEYDDGLILVLHDDDDKYIYLFRTSDVTKTSSQLRKNFGANEDIKIFSKYDLIILTNGLSKEEYRKVINNLKDIKL